MKRRFRNLLPLLVAVFFLATLFAGSFSLADEPPIQIEADHMVSVEGSNSVHFSGNVDARQGKIRIRCDEMTVYYTKADKNAKATEQTSQQVEKLYCVGNVQVTNNDWLGTSDKLVYLKKTRQAILIGHAKAWQGQNMVSGAKIIYYIDEGRSEVIRGPAGPAGSTIKNKKPGRVNMTILQK
jgi:lipopolysaccharide export system protein LptA